MTQKFLTPSQTDAGDNHQLFEMIDRMQQRMELSRSFAELGVDDELIRTFRSYLENPQTMVDAMADNLGRMFIVSWWDAARTRDLARYTTALGASLNGARVDVWIFLKEAEFTFENRSKFYDLNAEISNSSVFSKVCADLHLLKESDTSLPEDFVRINL